MFDKGKDMKKYLIKKTYTALKTNSSFNKGYIEVWYIGKDCCDKELCDYIKEKGYTRKHFAQKYIDKDKDFEFRYPQDFWKIDYEIIEVEA